MLKTKNSSKQQLQLLHNQLDLQLNQNQTSSEQSQNQIPSREHKVQRERPSIRYNSKQKQQQTNNKFSSLRYKPKDNQNTSYQGNRKPYLNQHQEQDSVQQEDSHQKVSVQKHSLFRRSLQKKQQLQKSLNKSVEKENVFRNKSDANSLKGSRKSEINELQRKLMDLQRKMDNISIDSDDSFQDIGVQSHKDRNKNDLKVDTKTFSSDKARQFDSSQRQSSQAKINLKENQIKDSHIPIVKVAQKNQGTARFSIQYQEVQKYREDQRQKQKCTNIIKSGLNNKKNYLQQQDESEQEDSDGIDIDIKYQRYTKNKLSNIHEIAKKLQTNKRLNEQDEDYSNQNQRHMHNVNKSIEKRPMFSNQIIKQKHKSSSNLQKLNKIVKNNHNINQHAFQDEDRKHSVETESLLKPKYKASRQKTQPQRLNLYNFNKSTQKRHSQQKKQPNSFRSIPNDKKSKKSKSKLSSNNKMVRQNSSKKSLRSNLSKKKSIKIIPDNMSVKSYQKSFNYDQQEGINLDSIKQAKKMQNLQKQVEHYKRLARKLQQKVDQMRIIQIQYKKLKNNFGKSEQIRVQQKKIIQQLKGKQK